MVKFCQCAFVNPIFAKLNGFSGGQVCCNIAHDLNFESFLYFLSLNWPVFVPEFYELAVDMLSRQMLLNQIRWCYFSNNAETIFVHFIKTTVQLKSQAFPLSSEMVCKMHKKPNLARQRNVFDVGLKYNVLLSRQLKNVMPFLR